VQAIHSIQTQIQQAADDAATGTAILSGITCTGNASGITIGDSAGQQQTGTNQGCTLIGNAIDFPVPPPTSSPEQTVIYPVVGLQCSLAFLQTGASYTVCPPPTSITDADPTLDTNSIDVSNINLENGLSTPNVTADNPSVNGSNMEIAFISNASALDLSSGNSGNAGGTGAEPVTLYTVTNTGNGYIFTPKPLIDLCFVSSSSTESGLITVGNSTNNVSSLGINLQLFSDTNCT
jgi:hypothetical protein